MKIAVAIFRDNIAPRLDFAEAIITYKIENNLIKEKKKVELLLDHPLEIIDLLKDRNINTVICGGGPRGFLRRLSFYNFDLRFVPFGLPEKAVDMYLKGQLPTFDFGFREGCWRNKRRRIRRGKNK